PRVAARVRTVRARPGFDRQRLAGYHVHVLLTPRSAGGRAAANARAHPPQRGRDCAARACPGTAGRCCPRRGDDRRPVPAPLAQAPTAELPPPIEPPIHILVDSHMEEV